MKPATVRRIHAIISSALNYAVSWGWVEKNPAAFAHPPALGRRGARPPAPAKVAALLNGAFADDAEFGVFLWLVAAVAFAFTFTTSPRTRVRGPARPRVEVDTVGWQWTHENAPLRSVADRRHRGGRRRHARGEPVGLSPLTHRVFPPARPSRPPFRPLRRLWSRCWQ
jgi:hypothetical protein